MSFSAFLFKSMDPVLKHVQLTPEYHMYVINPVLWLLDMQHVQRNFTWSHLLEACTPASKHI